MTTCVGQMEPDHALSGNNVFIPSFPLLWWCAKAELRFFIHVISGIDETVTVDALAYRLNIS